MAEKENNQKHKSTIDKYFSRTADGYKAWAEEAEEETFEEAPAEAEALKESDEAEEETADAIDFFDFSYTEE